MRSGRCPRRACIALAFAFAMMGAASYAAGSSPPAIADSSSQHDLTGVAIEDLMNIEVTSVSKRVQPLSETPSAVTVIDHEEIRRSTATSVPELLRMVPGLDVAQIDANKWAISARGFSGRYGNKMLVLIDGRSVYSPLFAGVYWDVQDVMLEDVERIEVIRGPGGTVWGANAVNGVINIITKPAEDTQGVLFTGGSGSEERGFGVARIGAGAGTRAPFRASLHYRKVDPSIELGPLLAFDTSHLLHGGLRTDWTISGRSSLTLQGDLYGGNENTTSTIAMLSPPFMADRQYGTDLGGGNALARWSHTFSDRSDVKLQIYYDQAGRDAFLYRERVQTADQDFQHHVLLGSRQNVVWGFGHRYIRLDLGGSPTISFASPRQTVHLLECFVQDEIEVVANRLRVTLGSKGENHSEFGFELSPTARIAWTPDAHQTLWAAVSRAVRTPARIESDLRADYAAFPGGGGPPNEVALFGNKDQRAEVVIAKEAGYRVEPRPHLALDGALFYNNYDDLRTYEPETPYLEMTPAPPHVVVPLRWGNLMKGRTYGAEGSVAWMATSNWRLTAQATVFRMDLMAKPASVDTASSVNENNDPESKLSLSSNLIPVRNLECDATIQYVGGLTTQKVPAYTRIDLRVGWHLIPGLELSVAGLNLLDDRHPEWSTATELAIPSEVERSGYGKLTWRF